MSIKSRISRVLDKMPPLPEKAPSVHFLIGGITNDGLTAEDLQRMKPPPVVFVIDGIIKDAD